MLLACCVDCIDWATTVEAILFGLVSLLLTDLTLWQATVMNHASAESLVTLFAVMKL